MADLIAKTADNRDAIAYVGATPWHNKGQRLTPDAPRIVWEKEAGFDFKVFKSPVCFSKYEDNTVATLADYPAKSVLVRDDIRTPLGIVSNGYNIVQPSEVLDFFEQFVEAGGMRLETAGVLDGGKKLWALAKLNEGYEVNQGDRVYPYLLLYTSFDGKFATTARLTGIRVVCWNTLSAAHHAEGSAIRVPHTQVFDKAKVADELGVMPEVFFKWTGTLREMASTPLKESDANDFLIQLITPFVPKEVSSPEIVKESRNYKKMMAMFQEGSGLIGRDLDGGHTKWRMMNVVSQLVDHEIGSNRTRLSSAWFGRGESIKNHAFDLLTAE